MLESDLQYTEKERYECLSCRVELIHHRTGFDVQEFRDGTYQTLLIMKCRVCGEKGKVPASMFDTGKLGRLKIRR